MITVSPAGPGDAADIAALLEEMDRFYGATESDPPGQRTRQVTQALFTSPAAAHTLLARDSHHLAGIAAYSFLWPAVGLTRSAYLKELYVAAAYRRRGVGKLLMSALFETASERGCSRVEWTTDVGNEGARAFYESLGFAVSGSKVFYRTEDTGTGLPTAGQTRSY
jgi:ribosomal protein S18 acetylase RimI-like enzyme